MEKTVIWKLTPGIMEGQETADAKRIAGYAYIEMLSKTEEIINVIDEGNLFRIIIKE